jgi:AP-3 complex subunit delta
VDGYELQYTDSSTISLQVNKDNIQSIVQQVLSHLVPETSLSTLPTAAQSLAQHSILTPGAKLHTSPSQSPAYRLVLSQRILNICSQNTYENVTNFEWYISVLVDLAHVANVNVGVQIRDQLVDVVGRVRAVRRYAVKLMYTMLSDETMLRNAQDEGSCSEVLWAAAWICGEYCK